MENKGKRRSEKPVRRPLQGYTRGLADGARETAMEVVRTDRTEDFFLRVEPTEFADRLAVEYKERKESKMTANHWA